MLKVGLIGLAGVVWLTSCGSSTSNHSPGNDATHGGAGSTGDAGANAAAGATGGKTTSGGSHASGGTDASGGAGLEVPGDPTTAVGFCQGYYAIVGELFGKCWGLPPDQAAKLLEDPALCRAFTDSIDQKRIAFDGSHAKACLSELKGTESCDSATMTMAPDCAVIMPLVPTGGTCTSVSDLALGQECQTSDYCQEPKAYACSGVCTARAPIGAACNPTTLAVRCAADATCDTTTKKCVATPPAAAVNEACDGTARCARDLWCDTGGVCRAKKTSGACTANGQCQNPALCVGAEGAQACAAPKATGQSCTVGWRECNLFSHCGADQKCTDAEAALDEPCGILDGESVACVSGAYCDGALVGPGVCKTPKPAGAPCTGTSIGECDGARGHCDATDHTCVACP